MDGPHLTLGIVVIASFIGLIWIFVDHHKHVNGYYDDTDDENILDEYDQERHK